MATPWLDPANPWQDEVVVRPDLAAARPDEPDHLGCEFDDHEAVVDEGGALARTSTARSSSDTNMRRRCSALRKVKEAESSRIEGDSRQGNRRRRRSGVVAEVMATVTCLRLSAPSLHQWRQTSEMASRYQGSRGSP